MHALRNYSAVMKEKHIFVVLTSCLMGGRSYFKDTLQEKDNNEHVSVATRRNTNISRVEQPASLEHLNIFTHDMHDIAAQ